MCLTAILDFAEKNDVRPSRFSSILSTMYVILDTFLVINPKKKLLLQFVMG